MSQSERLEKWVQVRQLADAGKVDEAAKLAQSIPPQPTRYVFWT